MEDLSFDEVDNKLKLIMERNVSLELYIILNNIIDNAIHQTNSCYYAALEQFENKYLKPMMN